jgi:hypothetical protein
MAMLTGDRVVRLEISGICQQNISHTSNYTVTVPYGSMSKTMQSISRMGGKVVGVHVSDVPVATGKAAVVAPQATPKAEEKKKKK